MIDALNDGTKGKIKGYINGGTEPWGALRHSFQAPSKADLVKISDT